MKRETLMRKAADVREKSSNALALKLERLCEARLLMLRPWWHQRFPKRHLGISAQIDTISIDGRTVFLNPTDMDSPVQINMGKDVLKGSVVLLPYNSLEPLALALRDICSLTNGYRLATPRDFEIHPLV